jgi:hypothetical protein
MLGTLRYYGPVLTSIVLGTVQAAIVMAYRHHWNKRTKKRSEIGINIDPEEWMDPTLWDDVVCAVASTVILAALCEGGYQELAWVLIMPLIIVGGASTFYHFVDKIRHVKRKIAT